MLLMNSLANSDDVDDNNDDDNASRMGADGAIHCGVDKNWKNKYNERRAFEYGELA